VDFQTQYLATQSCMATGKLIKSTLARPWRTGPGVNHLKGIAQQKIPICVDEIYDIYDIFAAEVKLFLEFVGSPSRLLPHAPISPWLSAVTKRRHT